MTILNADLIQKAISDGHVISYEDEVKVNAKNSPDGKDHVAKYTRYEAVNAKGMLALCNGKMAPKTPKPTDGEDKRTDQEKEPGAADFFNYGFDLDVRAQARAKMLSGLESPEKAIAKVVKSLVDAGIYTESEARDFVIEQRKAKGLSVPQPVAA